MATAFSWTDPLRPYLILLTLGLLGYAWYQKTKPKPEVDCVCEPEKKSNFLHSKLFLWLITGFALLMLSFPYYASKLVAQDHKDNISTDPFFLNQVEFSIKGMTCSGCEALVNHQLSKSPGIVKFNTSYEKGNTVIEFDSSKTNTLEIKAVLEKTGYYISESNPQ